MWKDKEFICKVSSCVSSFSYAILQYYTLKQQKTIILLKSVYLVDEKDIAYSNVRQGDIQTDVYIKMKEVIIQSHFIYHDDDNSMR